MYLIILPYRLTFIHVCNAKYVVALLYNRTHVPSIARQKTATLLMTMTEFFACLLAMSACNQNKQSGIIFAQGFLF